MCKESVIIERTGYDKDGHTVYVKLGNIREVVSKSDSIEQVTNYYPFGTPIHDLSNNPEFQPFKYNEKELDMMHGIPSIMVHANIIQFCLYGIGWIRWQRRTMGLARMHIAIMIL